MWEQESEKNILIVGHRGIRSLYPENTLVSFRAALDLKLDLIEFDVHFTRDRHIVVCHDADIRRTTNGEGLICDMTLEELQTYDAGSHLSPQFAGEHIPTLKEVLKLMAGAAYPVLLNVEIKAYDHELVDQTIAELEAYGLAGRSVIACFNAEIIGYIQEAYPGMKTQGYPRWCMEPYTGEGYLITEELYEKMFGIGIPIAKDGEEEKMHRAVAMAKQYGIRPWLFCADDEDSVKKAVEAGATNITCNNPYPAIAYLVREGLHKLL